jgi:PAS domain S-box-containing protein
VLAPGKDAELAAIMDKSTRAESGEAFETQRTRKDGSIIDISLAISPIRDATGRVTSVSAIARDITSRKKSEAALKRLNDVVQLQRLRDVEVARKRATDLERQVAERQAAETAVRAERDRAQQYLDTAEVALLALDVDGRVTLINRSGCDLLGWTERELVGRDFLETCLPARSRAVLKEKLAAAIIGGLSAVEAHVLTKSGEERLVDWRTTVRRDESEQVVGTFSSGTDITDRNQAVEAVRTAEERMRFALEAAGVGIWDLDYATGSLRWSETLEAQYGLDPGTFDGTFEAFMACIHPDDRESVLETVGKAMASGTDFTIQNRSIWPDGTVQWLNGAGRIHLGLDGTPVRGIGISQNVTARTRAEAELTRLNDEIQLQRLRVFKATMRTVQDIVNNLLNGFQLVQLEAGNQLPPEMLTLIDQMIDEASTKLKALGGLETVKEKEMAVGLGIDYPGSF